MEERWCLHATLGEHTGHCCGVAFFPNEREVLTTSWDRTAKIWDATDGRCTRTLDGHTNEVLAVAVFPDGGRAITGSRDSSAKIWDAATGEVLQTIQDGSGVYTVAVFQDGQRVLTAGLAGAITIWQLGGEGDAVPLSRLEGHSRFVYSAALFPGDAKLASGDDTGLGLIWDTSTGQQLVKLEHRAGAMWGIAVFPSGDKVITGSDQGGSIWDAASGQRLIELPCRAVWSVAVFPSGDHVITGTKDGYALIWDALTGEVVAKLEGHDGDVRGVAVLPCGTRIVTVSYDKTAKIWHAEKKVPLQLHAEKGEDGLLTVTCTNMGGECLGELTSLDPEERFVTLVALLDQRVGKPPGYGSRWQVVAGDRTPDNDDLDLTLGALFEL